MNMCYMSIMTVRTSVSFTNHNHAFARSLVQQGTFNSVSAVVAAGLQELRDKSEERSLALGAMVEEIRQRDRTPREEFIDFDAETLLRRMDERNAGRNRTER